MCEEMRRCLAWSDCACASVSVLQVCGLRLSTLHVIIGRLRIKHLFRFLRWSSESECSLCALVRDCVTVLALETLCACCLRAALAERKKHASELAAGVWSAVLVVLAFPLESMDVQSSVRHDCA